jgi:A/G-specific adenine glycosylase
MQKAARLIMARYGGQFPATFEDVLDLPGIGRYTAGAICSIAFNQPRPILDGNVIRVLTRVFGIDGSPKEKSVNAHLWHLAERLVESAAASAEISNLKSQISNPRPKISNFKSQISNLNESLMELGALICIPRQPNCHICPITRWCVARKQGRTEELPCRTERPVVTRRRFVAFITHRKSKFLVQQRAAGVVNAHLWEFPNVEVSNDAGDPSKAAILIFGSSPSAMEKVCTIRHSITRYRIRLDVYQTAATNRMARQQKNGRWCSRRELARLPFCSAHKKILAVL